MTTLTIPNSFNNGDVIDAPEMNANFTAVKNFVEDLSAGDNFDAGAINTSDIADSAITAAKIGTGAVTSAKIQTSVSLTTPNIGAATGTSLTATGNVISHILTTSQVASYTLVAGDDGTIVQMNVASSNNLTVPPNSSVAFTIGTTIIIQQAGAGQTTIVAGAGVTLNATPGLKLRAQYSGAVCIKYASDAWFVFGDLSA
jgi:hypothetical protein